ncbi:MAG: STT3 domain-containing protein [Candidatus Asgardarchaeia archaeon]
MGIVTRFRTAFNRLKKRFYGLAEKVSRLSIVRVSTLLFIFTLALILRICPYFFYEPLLRGFDPWFQLRVAEFLINNGVLAWFSWNDNMSWYPFGRDIPRTTYPGTPFTAYFLYLLLNFLGIKTDIYYVAYFMPAFMGAVTTVIMYLLGKEFGGEKVGLLSAFFLAITPGYIQRTVVGFFDNEAVGIFSLVLTFYFYLRSLKYESLIDGVLAGLSLGYLSASWGASIYPFDLIALNTLVMILIGRYSNKVLVSYTTTMGLALPIAVLVPRNGIKLLTSAEGLPALFVFFVIFLMELTPILGKVYSKVKFLAIISASRVSKSKYRIVIYSLALLLGVSALVFLYMNIGAVFEIELIKIFGVKFWVILNPLFREQSRIFASVMEQLPTTWANFYYDLHLLLLFMLLGVYFCFRRLKDEDIFLLIFGITIIYFSGSLVRIILILAPAAALLGAYGLVSIWTPLFEYLKAKPSEPLRRRRKVGRPMRKEAAVFAISVLFLMMVFQISHDVSVAANPSPSELMPSPQLKDWQEALYYMKYNLPKGSVIACWWDYGYWITTIANQTSLADNATLNTTQIALIGYAFMSEDIIQTLRILRTLNATHILVHFGLLTPGLGGDEFKWTWMAEIAEDVFGPEVVNFSRYYLPDSGVQPAFFNTTIYKLLLYGEPAGPYQSYVQQRLQQLGREWYYNIPYRIEFIEEEYISKNRMVKLYRIDWDSWYQYMEENNLSIELQL